MKSSLIAKNLGKKYNQGGIDFPVFQQLSAEFDPGISYAITGISGCGKSTLMHLLASIDIPSQGHVYYNGRAIDELPIAERNFFLNYTIGLVFQYAYLIKELTIIENVMIKGLIGGMPHEECRENSQRLLQILGLGDKTYARPGQLSGGQQQRVAIARALLNKPIFLLADEPTGSLDEKTGTELVNLLLQLQQDWRIGLIISSHDAYVSNRMQHIFDLSYGKLEQKR